MKTIIYILLFISTQTVFAQNTWKKIESNTNLKLNSISFGTSQVGYIGADDTTLLKTIDGGATWNTIPVTGINFHFANDIVHVEFLNANEGYIIVNNSESSLHYNGATLFTKDGGNTWNYKNRGMCGAIKSFYFDTANGYGIGSTCFGGRTIDKIVNDTLVSTTYHTYRNNFLRGIDFLNNSYGITAGDSGYIYRTTNSGVTWDTISRPFIQSVFDIKFINDTLIFLVVDSSNNSIYYSNDSGYTWQEHLPSLTFFYPILKSLVVSDKDTVFAVGHSVPLKEGFIIWGKNSSSNWHFFTTSKQGKGFNSVTMRNSTHAFAVGDSGIIYSNNSNLTSLNSEENEHKLTVYPNPTQSFITIQSQKMKEIEIINIQGKVISKIKVLNSNSVKISLADYLSGLYLVKIVYNDKSIRFKKIIKN